MTLLNGEVPPKFLQIHLVRELKSPHIQVYIDATHWSVLYSYAKKMINLS